MKNAILFLALSLLPVPPANAGIFEDCQEAVESGDATKAKQFSEVISRFNVVPSPTDQILGASCFTFAMGEPYVFSNVLGAFAPGGAEAAVLLEKQQELAAEQQESERQAKEAERQAKEMKEIAQLKAKFAAEARRISDDKHNTVLEAAYEACRELFQRDRVEALTNERCLQFFFATGLPEG